MDSSAAARSLQPAASFCRFRGMLMLDLKRQIYLIGFRAMFIDFAKSLTPEQLEKLFEVMNLDQAK